MKIRVIHSSYGCETGCCGHVIEIDGEREGGFGFDHKLKSETDIDFAKRLITQELGEEHVKDLNWDDCEVISSSC